MFIASKCIKYYIRRLSKLFGITVLGLLMIASFIYMKYKPLYKVTLNGEVIGYVENKEKMQEQIEAFENNLEGNITSIEVKDMPVYELELVSSVKESETSEQEVLAKIEEEATIMCKTYAIKLDDTVKANVNSEEEANNVINEIKADTIEGVELNLTVEEEVKEKKEVEEIETTTEIAKLNINQDVEVKVKEYEEKKAQEEAAARAAKIAAAKKASQVSSRSSSKTSSYSTAGASAAVTSSGMFMRPVSGGTITSPYGARSSGFHTGLDIAVPTGTPVYAAAGGTVTKAGWQGGYGYLVVIDHGNGYQTYYAHNSSLCVSVGQSVSMGQNIAYSGSTGNSTGPHLHFEVRINGATQNPQNYI